MYKLPVLGTDTGHLQSLYPQRTAQPFSMPEIDSWRLNIGENGEKFLILRLVNRDLTKYYIEFSGLRAEKRKKNLHRGTDSGEEYMAISLRSA